MKKILVSTMFALFLLSGCRSSTSANTSQRSSNVLRSETITVNDVRYQCIVYAAGFKGGLWYERMHQ